MTLCPVKEGPGGRWVWGEVPHERFSLFCGESAAASTSKSRTCTGREWSVPAKKNKRETKDGVERIRPKWLIPFFIVLQYI